MPHRLPVVNMGHFDTMTPGRLCLISLPLALGACSDRVSTQGPLDASTDQGADGQSEVEAPAESLESSMAELTERLALDCPEVPSGTEITTNVVVTSKIAPDVDYTQAPEVGQVLVLRLVNDLPELPQCSRQAAAASLGDVADCSGVDEFLEVRTAVQRKRLQCVVEVAGSPEGRNWWYEEPFVFSDGTTAAELMAFGVALLGTSVETVAAHPYVAGLANPPAIFPEVTECPPLGDHDGRQRVTVDGSPQVDEPRYGVVTMRQPVPCTDCDERNTQRLTGILGSRALTCVLQQLKNITGEFELLDQGAVHGTVGDPLTVWQSEFAAPLTLNQAAQLARQPAVESIRLTETPLPVHEVPAVDLNEGPCPEPQEVADAETIAEKVGEFVVQEGSEVQQVSIVVRGGGVPAGAGDDITCPNNQRECPERLQVVEDSMEANRISQRCVRAFISELGGTRLEEVFFGNSFQAWMNWEQILRLAPHPHVLWISAPGPPPPPP